MKVSYHWLQKYFDKKLPSPEELVSLITFGFAEVEGIEKCGDDTVIDVKILPDRACYALSHRGVAGEIAALTGIPLKRQETPAFIESDTLPLSVTIAEKSLCTKFVGRRIENISVKASPEWLMVALKSIGQRSINNIVDVTNYVMFDIGRPLHAFDADKVEGDLVIRFATAGERITTLDNKDIALTESTLVIADNKGPLSIAGIKGGKRAEVDGRTKNIILEAANWNASHIRKTSTVIGVRTDASKRFENRLSSSLAEEGIDAATQLVTELASSPAMKIGKRVDLSFEVEAPRTISITATDVSRVLGVSIDEKEMEEILARLSIPFVAKGGDITITPPAERLDMEIPEDIAEEIGRILGYDKIKGTLPRNTTFTPTVNKIFYYTEKIKNILVGQGFSEVYLYTLVAKGDIETEHPLADDKAFLRKNLTDGMMSALVRNHSNAALLGLDHVAMFEIGKVFKSEGEFLSLSIAVAQVKKIKGQKPADIVGAAFALVAKELAMTLSPVMTMLGNDAVGEVLLDDVIKNLPQHESYSDLNFTKALDIKYKRFSAYPFIVRDIALFVPSETKPEEVIEVIKKEGTDLMIKGPTLFDDFTKEGKRSLAFRMIFQSMERTLSDEEVNVIMRKIYIAVKAKGWEVR